MPKHGKRKQPTVKKVMQMVKSIRPPLNHFVSSPAQITLSHTGGASGYAAYNLSQIATLSSLSGASASNAGRLGYSIKHKFLQAKIRIQSLTTAGGNPTPADFCNLRHRVMLVWAKDSIIQGSLAAAPAPTASTLTLADLLAFPTNTTGSDDALYSVLTDDKVGYKKYKVIYDKVLVPDGQRGQMNTLSINKRLMGRSWFSDFNADANSEVRGSLHLFIITASKLIYAADMSLVDFTYKLWYV